MTTGQNAFRPGLPPSSTAFVHFALDVVDLLRQADPWGLDQDGFLDAYFQGNQPSGHADRDRWWEEFKRAAAYSNKCFNRGDPAWAMIRARPGQRLGQFFYHVVGRRDNSGRVLVESDPASMDLLDDYTDRRWQTQTKSRQRVRAAEALSLIRRGNATNDQNLINRGQDILNQFVILSPGLAAINFDTGMVMEDLQRLANSSDPRIRLLHNQIQNALRSGRRFEQDVDNLVNVVLALAQIYSQGSMRSLP